MQREAFPRRVESSSAAAPGLVGRAAVAPAFAASLAEFGGASLLVEPHHGRPLADCDSCGTGRTRRGFSRTRGGLPQI